MSQSAQSKNVHEPKNEKDENYSIASVIVNSIKTIGTYKSVTNKRHQKIDEYHIKADMDLTLKWHDPISGKWKESTAKFSKNYNHSQGERPPKLHNPLVFTRTPTGGFEL